LTTSGTYIAHRALILLNEPSPRLFKIRNPGYLLPELILAVLFACCFPCLLLTDIALPSNCICSRYFYDMYAQVLSVSVKDQSGEWLDAFGCGYAVYSEPLPRSNNSYIAIIQSE